MAMYDGWRTVEGESVIRACHGFFHGERSEGHFNVDFWLMLGGPIHTHSSD